MTIVITDAATHIEFAYAGEIATEKFLLPYGEISLKLGDDFVTVSSGGGFSKGQKVTVLELDYTKVTTPVYASNSLMYDGLKAMLTT